MKEFVITFSPPHDEPVLEAPNPTEAELVSHNERVIGTCKNGPRVMDAILSHPIDVKLMCGENWFWGMTLAEMNNKPEVYIVKDVVRATYIATTDLRR